MSGITANDVRRFEAKVDRDDAGCWLWTASVTYLGYGRFRTMAHGEIFAHRFSYLHHVGPIPEGLVLDHLCRVRHCVNPAHLEPVTHRENLLRGQTLTAANAAKTHCPKNHPYDEANTDTRDGCRRCRICRREAARARAAIHGSTGGWAFYKAKKARALLESATTTTTPEGDHR